MKLIINQKKIDRNRRIGRITLAVTLIGLVIATIYAFQAPINNDTNSLALAWGILLVVLIAMQVSIYMLNRYDRSPREDEIISHALKTLDDRYSLYHYKTAISHLLVGPAGIWAIQVYHQRRGTIVYEKNRWKQRSVNIFWRIFSQESLGRPDVEVRALQEDGLRMLKPILSSDEMPPVHVALVFADTRINLEAKDAPNPTIHPKDLKEAIQRKAKQSGLPLDVVKKIIAALPQE